MTKRTLHGGALPLLAFLLALTPARSVRAQGCVASRGAAVPGADNPGADMGSNPNLAGAPEAGSWLLSIDYRNFLSDHDYVGTTENARIGTGVFNHENLTNFGITYILDPRYSATFSLPFVINDRSQVTNGFRFHTDAEGLGDASIEVNGWVVDPKTHPKGNFLLGLGLSMPTGQDNDTGTFLSYNAKANAYTATVKPLDESIQPGTGGWSTILDFYGYHEVGLPGLSVYGSATYSVVIGSDTNGVLTYRSNPYEAVTAITDTYLYRAGLEYAFLPQYGLSGSFGVRMEGVPVRNWFGDSAGFRRPGYSLEWDPGIAWSYKQITLRAYLPFSFYHNREQSLADREQQAATGTYQHGDAFFANYQFILSFSTKL